MIPADPYRNLGPATILRTDARTLPLADNSVDLIVTSPPYFALRSYRDGGEHYAGQLGSEATPAEFVDALIDCTREMVRVVKPSGSIWINLGDLYSKGQSLDSTLTATDAAWLAGLIDADGSIVVRRTQQPTMRAPTFEGVISVEQRDESAVRRAHETTGLGRVHVVTGSRDRPMFRWTVSTQQARWVAERIWPFLQIKRRQALAVVELADHREKCQARGRYSPIRTEWIEYRQMIRDAVRAWNARDEHAWEPPALPVVDLPLRPRFLPVKSLAGIPWRYALRCIDDLGLILRAEVIWSKPNGLPESVTDRVRRSHEQWFHFTLQPRYYSAVDEIREKYSLNKPWGPPGPSNRPGASAAALRGHRPEQHQTGLNADRAENPLGKLPGSVWTIPTEPLRAPDHLGVDHFAAFPSEWPKRIIRGWSPAGVCTACGEGRRPVMDADWTKIPHRLVEKRALTADETAGWCQDFADWCDSAGVSRNDLDRAAGTSDMGGWWASRLPHRSAVPTPEQWAALRQRIDPPIRFDALVHLTRMVPTGGNFGGDVDAETGLMRRHRTGVEMASNSSPPKTITGYACACPEPTAPTTPARILDPFGGSGTVAMVARALGRHGIHADLSADYNRLARWRITDLDQLAHIQGHERTKREPDGDDLLTLLDDGGAA